MKESNPPVCALIVCYNPDINLLQSALESLKNQVDKIYIFNNGDPCIDLLNLSNVYILSSDTNLGIAKAQNILIKRAMEDEFNYVLFSDQDTLYPPGYITKLIEVLTDNKNALGAVPSFTTKLQTGESYFSGFTVEDDGSIKKYHGSEPINILHAISSGMIVRADIFSDLGGCDELLFIDWVDNDVCWRAYMNNHSIIGVPSAIIEHQLGDEKVKILGRNFTKRNVTRDYYIIRNSIYLAIYRYHKQPLIRNYLMKKTVHHIVFSILASKRKKASCLIAFKAFYHGVTKKLGSKELYN